MTQRKYYTLAVREHWHWTPEFGDYDRETVEYELEDQRSKGRRAKDLRIICTGPLQVDINKAIAGLNGVRS